MNHYSPRTTSRYFYNRNPEGKKILCVSYNNEPCHYSKKNSDDFFKSEAAGEKEEKIDFQSLMCSIQYIANNNIEEDDR